MKLFKEAKWIWTPNLGDVNVYADFKCEFDYAPNLRIRIACDGNYALYINGSLVDFGQYQGYADMQFCDEYAVDKFARQGKNELVVVVHHPGVSFSTYRKANPGVIFELTSGDEVVYATSTDTLSRPNPYFATGEEVGKVSVQLGFTFALDLTASDVAYAKSIPADRIYDFSDRPIEKLVVSDDAPATVIELGSFADTRTDGTAAQRMNTAELSKCGDFKPVAFDGNSVELNANSDNVFALVDLGRESAGVMSLDVEVEEDCEILVGWGEHITDGRTRCWIAYRNFAASIKLKAGRNVVVNPLLRLGLRYLELHAYTKSIKLNYLGIKNTDYPLPAPTPCPVDDELHRRIYDVCIPTLQLCMHEHYEDCPWREQALYTMDSRNQMLCGYYVFGETRFVLASLKLAAHSLREDNLLELCSPAEVRITIPCFSAVFMTQVWEYLKYSGDAVGAAELLETAEKIAHGFIDRILPNGLLYALPEAKYWNFYEWQDGLSDGGHQVFEEGNYRLDAPLCAFVAMGLDSLANVCDNLGNGRADFYREKAAALKSAMQAFWSDEEGCYATYIQNGEKQHYAELTNSLVLYCGAVPADKVASVRARLMDDSLIYVTLSHSIFKYDVLLEDRANVDYVMGDIAKKWGYMLDCGATSFWETILGEKDFSQAGSLCHGWSATPAYVYHKLFGKQPAINK